jgi:4-hydroxybenzoate polyprenyltransferase
MFGSATSFGQSFSKLSRPQNVVYPGLLSAFTGYIISNSGLKAIACYFSIFFLYSIAAAYNNLTDIKTDRLNKRADNPLTNKTIKNSALLIFFILNIVSIALLQFLIHQPFSALICFAYGLLLIAYSHPRLNIKSKGYFATVLLSISYGSLPFLLGAVQGSHLTTHTIYICVFQALLIFPIVLAKDYKDLKGDRLTNKKTPLVKYGFNAVMVVAIFIALLASFMFLNLETGQSLFKLLSMATLYFFLIVWIHRNRGRINHYIRLILTMNMLAMSLLVIAK